MNQHDGARSPRFGGRRGATRSIPIGRRACQYDDTALVIELHEMVAGLPTDSY